MPVFRAEEVSATMVGDGSHLGLGLDGFSSRNPWRIRVACLLRSAGGLLGFKDKDQ